MEFVLNVLAAAGIATAVWHLVRAALRFLREAAAGIWAGEMAETHARQGDLTAMEQDERERAEARRSAARSGLAVAGWLVALVVPAFTVWARPIYAAFALLLLEPAVRGARR